MMRWTQYPRKVFFLIAFMLGTFSSATAADLPKLKMAVLGFGTVLWELDTIKHYGIDHANGFDLEILEMANGSATRLSLIHI